MRPGMPAAIDSNRQPRKTMPPTISWTTDKPSHPPADQIEDAALYALYHLIDPRGIRDDVTDIFLERDRTSRIVQGVGYGHDQVPLVKFHYSLHEPLVFRCEYFDGAPTQQS